MSAGQFFSYGNDMAQVRYALSKLPRTVGNRIVRRGLRASAKVIRDEMKRVVPVGETGQLKRSIKVRAARRSRKGPGVLISISRKLNEDGFYAPFIELGTKHRKRADGTREEGYRIAPRHWQERAFDRKKNAAIREFTRTFKRDLELTIRNQRSLKR